MIVIPAILTKWIVGGTLGVAAIGTVGTVTSGQEVPPPPEKRVVRHDETPRPDGNTPEADWRDYESPHKDDAAPDSTETAPQQPQSPEPAQEAQNTEPASPQQESEGKVQAEDGSWVDPNFYDRTDYNRNGQTDQDEPGWNNGAGEETFKAEGASKFRDWCEQQDPNHECRN